MSGDLHLEDVAIKYKTTVKKADLTHIKVNCESASGDKVKEEVPLYAGNGPECFLMTLKTLEMLQKRYDWMNDADTIKLAFESMGRALEDSTLDTWEDRVTTLRNNQKNTETGYDKAKGELIQK
eukprot:14441609-Ditylum_brightwellii.AAC.1